MGDWKAVRQRPGAPLELYNLRPDPGETSDVATANPAIVAEIEGLMRTARTQPRPHAGGSPQFMR